MTGNRGAKPFAKFLERYPPDRGYQGQQSDWTERDTRALVGHVPSLFTEFICSAAASSHGEGLIRFVLPEGKLSLRNWNGKAGWTSSWKEWAKRLVVFGYDWLGSQIGFDRERIQRGEPLVAMLDPGTGELLEIPASFEDYLSREVMESADAALAVNFYKKWRAAGGKIPRPDQCVGYKQPLFLGGKDRVDNLELSDLDVYLSLSGQLYAGTQ